MTALRSVSTGDSQLFAALRQFLCTRYWLPDGDFPLCGDVFNALRLSGDDCHEFMHDFSNEFDVDLTDYVWPQYHLAEDEAMDVRAALRPLMRMAGLKTQPLNRDLVPISIDHLLHVVQMKRWVAPSIDDLAETHAGLSRSIQRFSARLRAGGVPRRQRR